MSLKTFITVLALLFLAGPPPCSGEISHTNSIGMKFVKIPAGSFIMGSPEDEPGRDRNEKQHRVFITRPFLMSMTEVTQSQWYKVMGNNPSSFNQCGGNCPVENVSWFDCQEFIKRLNALERTRAYRLPTEAEWEYACRAGSPAAFSGGDITHTDCTVDPVLDRIGWYCGNTGETAPVDPLSPEEKKQVIGNLSLKPVAKKEPNRWGLYDMHGNVQEWVLDACEWRRWGWVGVFTKTYVDGIRNPISRKGSRRIIRGGSWNKRAKLCRSANRSYYRPQATRNSLGFRIIKLR